MKVTSAPGPVDIGAPEQCVDGSLTFIEPARSYRGRDERGFYPIVVICKHLGCTPRLRNNTFVCACHGSRCTREGQVLNGPATRPLDHALVKAGANGHLVDCRDAPSNS